MIWFNAVDKQITSVELLDFFVKQLPFEKDNENIQNSLRNLVGLHKVYLPTKNRESYLKKSRNMML